MNEEWIYHTPEFECDRINPDLLKYSPWSGHRLFAYDYVVNMRPERIVELGSYYGCSSFAFLQAVKDAHLETGFFAIDTWEGDPDTDSDYREDIFGSYREIAETCFREQHAEMMRMHFDDAADAFEDGSIDLLHLDGDHNYEEVRHDFETWLPKLSRDAAVFLHDIAPEPIYGRIPGSSRLWEELSGQLDTVFSFPFCHGLGIYFTDRGRYEQFCARVDGEYYVRKLFHSDLICRDRLRKQHFALRDLRTYAADLGEQAAICRRHLERYRCDTEARNAYILELQDTIRRYEETLAGKDAWIAELEREASHRTVYIIGRGNEENENT
ncbi:MAG: class I SAM-dependent methyltransferase [Lachnospiraceae bacterium]|nr:class I SAM-dependent methyltransferase [Lachnospiraceae bacterium]